MRCPTRELSQDCGAYCFAPELGLRCTSQGRQWGGLCPSCGHKGFSLTARNGTLLWNCHWETPCSQEALTAALTRKVPSHFPASRQRKPRPRSDRQIIAELTQLLDKPVNGNAFRLQAAMLLLEVDSKAAAERLKIPERTRRRLLCP